METTIQHEKDLFIRKALRSLFDETTQMSELISTIETAELFGYEDLKNEMIRDLGRDELRRWNMHVESNRQEHKANS